MNIHIDMNYNINVDNEIDFIICISKLCVQRHYKLYFHIKNISFQVPFKRSVFHEITKDAILKSFENPREIDMNIVQSQETRRSVRTYAHVCFYYACFSSVNFILFHAILQLTSSAFITHKFFFFFISMNSPISYLLSGICYLPPPLPAPASFCFTVPILYV